MTAYPFACYFDSAFILSVLFNLPAPAVVVFLFITLTVYPLQEASILAAINLS